MNKNDIGLVLIVLILVSGCVTQNVATKYLDKTCGEKNVAVYEK